jgi:hypothetical protein
VNPMLAEKMASKITESVIRCVVEVICRKYDARSGVFVESATRVAAQK